MLTIAIPTYNRADKVKKLLGVIKDEIFSSQLQDQVAVIVSNNASTDKTHSFDIFWKYGYEYHGLQTICVSPSHQPA